MARSDFTHKMVDGGRVNLSESEVDALVAAEEAFAANQAANGYKTSRQGAYAPLQDQLDMQYWDAVNGTTTWKDHVSKIKSDNPKPE